jgi:ABC-type multidrug transport system fused ATPase/permease subunit
LNKYLKKKYLFFVQNNSAVLLRNIDKEVSQMTDQTILSFITLLVEFLILIGVATILITINLKIFFSTMTIFFIIVLVYYLLVKNYILKLGKNRQRLTFHYLKSLNQIFKGIKTIKINKKEPFFEKIFQSVSLKLQKVNVIAITFSQIPRLTIEFCLILIISIYLMKLYFFNQSLNSDSNELSVLDYFLWLLSELSLLLLKSYQGFQKLKYSSSSVDLVHQEIEQSKNSEDEILNIENNSLDFNHNITLKNIYFSYHNNDNYNLKNINLEIKKNQILGIVGKSGAGKSTLVDLIAGLIPPQKGQIL